MSAERGRERGGGEGGERARERARGSEGARERGSEGGRLRDRFIRLTCNGRISRGPNRLDRIAFSRRGVAFLCVLYSWCWPFPAQVRSVGVGSACLTVTRSDCRCVRRLYRVVSVRQRPSTQGRPSRLKIAFSLMRPLAVYRARGPGRGLNVA